MTNASTCIPEKWSTRMLAEVSDIKTGGTPSKDEPAFWGGSIPWMASGDVHLKRIRDVEGRITELGLKNSNARLLPPGTVMIAMNGQGKTRGTVAVLETSVTCNQSLAGIIPKSDFITSNFLFYNLESRYQEIRNLTGDGTRTGLNLKLIGDIQVTLPSLPEQRKIAAILTSVDDAIAATQRIINQTEVVKRGLMQQLLTKGIGHTEFKQTEIGEIPAEWDVVKLGEVADFINGRGFKPHEWSTSGLPIIRIQNLNGSTEFNYYEGEFNEKILIEPGTLLFAWSGSRGTSFGPHIWNGPQGVLNYHTWKVEHFDSVNRQYLYFALAKITAQIENDSHGASALVHMQKAYVVDYKIPLPPFEEQEEITCILQVYDKKLENERHSLLKLRELKQGLMQVLLTGKVRVNVDEPSEVSV